MLAIIVPYRDRAEHLAQFIPHMNKYLPDAKIVIVEQADEKPFNRGKLLNVGFLEVNPAYFVAHDVDMIPVKADYIERNNVTQMAYSHIQLKDYLGGVTMFERTAFLYSGGYHNDFFHRAEDNEMMFNLKNQMIPILYWYGMFKDLPHPRNAPEFIPELWQKAQLPRTVNMLETCKYELITKEEFDTHTHIKVLL